MPDKFRYQKLAIEIIDQIESGRLPYGAPLESTRDLSERLSISRETAVKCYRYLKDKHYIESEGPRGTFVIYKISAQAKPVDSKSRAQEIEGLALSRLGQMVACDELFHPQAAYFASLNYGAVPKEALPLKKWRELLQKRFLPANFKNLSYDLDVLGHAELKQALAQYLHRTKGIICADNEIALFNISISGVGLILNLLLEEGDLIAIEDPAFNLIKQVAKFQNLALQAVPLDDEGIDVDFLEQCPVPPKLVYVTPSHQDPTGCTMSLARRMQLLHWAKTHKSWIIEYDFDAFFFYGGARLPSLKSLDTTGRVIHVSTVWQVLYPLTTASYLVVPPALISAIERSKSVSAGVAESMMQLALADMLNTGIFANHLHRWNKIFAGRRRALIFELKQTFGNRIEIKNNSGGLNCMVSLNDWRPEDIRQAAERSKLPLLNLYDYFENNPQNQYLIYFAGIEESQSKRIVRDFATHLSAV